MSGKVAVEVPSLPRGVLFNGWCFNFSNYRIPSTFIFNGAISEGLWKYGLGLGTFSIVIPSIAFTIGIPKIGSGLATILGAAELPVTTIMSVFVLKSCTIFTMVRCITYFNRDCNPANCLCNAWTLS